MLLYNKMENVNTCKKVFEFMDRWYCGFCYNRHQYVVFQKSYNTRSNAYKHIRQYHKGQDLNFYLAVRVINDYFNEPASGHPEYKMRQRAHSI